MTFAYITQVHGKKEQVKAKSNTLKSNNLSKIITEHVPVCEGLAPSDASPRGGAKPTWYD